MENNVKIKEQTAIWKENFENILKYFGQWAQSSFKKKKKIECEWAQRFWCSIPQERGDPFWILDTSIEVEIEKSIKIAEIKIEIVFEKLIVYDVFVNQSFSLKFQARTADEIKEEIISANPECSKIFELQGEAIFKNQLNNLIERFMIA